MEAAFDDVKKQLFDQLHDVVRARLFYVRSTRACALLYRAAFCRALAPGSAPARLAEKLRSAAAA